MHTHIYKLFTIPKTCTHTFQVGCLIAVAYGGWIRNVSVTPIPLNVSKRNKKYCIWGNKMITTISSLYLKNFFTRLMLSVSSLPYTGWDNSLITQMKKTIAVFMKSLCALCKVILQLSGAPILQGRTWLFVSSYAPYF